MNEEAIERCKQIIKDNNEVIKEARKNRDINSMQLTASLDNDSIAIETVLNLIKTQQEELKKKDKIIYETARTLSAIMTDIPTIKKQFERLYCDFINSNEDCCWKTDKTCTDCIKQYFERKSENGN